MDGSQVTYLLSWAHTYGSRKACYALVVGSDSFRTDWLKMQKGGGLSTILRPGLKCGGLESKIGRGPRPRDRSGMGWSCLCLGYKGACVSGYLAGIHWFANRHFRETVWLDYGLVEDERLRKRVISGGSATVITEMQTANIYNTHVHIKATVEV